MPLGHNLDIPCPHVPRLEVSHTRPWSKLVSLPGRGPSYSYYAPSGRWCLAKHPHSKVKNTDVDTYTGAGATRSAGPITSNDLLLSINVPNEKLVMIRIRRGKRHSCTLYAFTSFLGQPKDSSAISTVFGTDGASCVVSMLPLGMIDDVTASCGPESVIPREGALAACQAPLPPFLNAKDG